MFKTNIMENEIAVLFFIISLTKLLSTSDF